MLNDLYDIVLESSKQNKTIRAIILPMKEFNQLDYEIKQQGLQGTQPQVADYFILNLGYDVSVYCWGQHNRQIIYGWNDSLREYLGPKKLSLLEKESQTSNQDNTSQAPQATEPPPQKN